MRAPVSGGVTNLLIRQGDHAVTGQTAMSIIDADSLGGADAGTHAAPQGVPAPGGAGAGTSLQLKTNPL